MIPRGQGKIINIASVQSELARPGIAPYTATKGAIKNLTRGMPLNGEPWLVVVCTDPDVPSSYRTFAASGRQGVNYARNCWHHPLLVVRDASPFVVIDRKGPGSNLEEKWLEAANWLRVAPDGAAAAKADITAKQG